MNYELPQEQWYDGKVAPGADSSCIFERFDAIKSKSKTRIEFYRFFMSLYHNDAIEGYGSDNSVAVMLGLMRDVLNENAIQRITSVLCAKFSRSRPRPSVLTDESDFGLMRRAKVRDRAIWASMRRIRAYELFRLSDLHMILCGTGAIYVGHRKGSVYGEIVPPWELMVDAAEARYGTPRTLYRWQCVDRRQFAKLHPKFKEEIMMARSTSFDDVNYLTGGNGDMIDVVTCWRLPSFEGAGDGRVAVAIDGTIIDGCEWKRDHFPIAISRFLLAPRGFFGVGAVETLVGLQLELNRTLMARQEAMALIKPYVLLEHGSKVVETDFSDECGNFIWYSGTKPEIVTPSAVNPETFNHSDRVKSSMFQVSGVSEFAASSMKPAGLNSGKALRAYSDMIDDSIHDILQRREQRVVDVGELILDALEDIDSCDDEEKSPLVYVGPFGIQKIDFSEFADDRDEFVLEVQPSSSLSTTLSGKLEDLGDMRDLGIISDPQQMGEMLEMPDLKSYMRNNNSMYELLRYVIEERILDDGDSITPEPTWDIELALKLCSQAMNRLQMQTNVPKGRYELLLAFSKKCIFYQMEAQKALAPSATPESIPGAGGGPMPGQVEPVQTPPIPGQEDLPPGPLPMGTE